MAAFLIRAASKPLNTYITGSGHIGFCDAETGVPVRHANGQLVALPNTPSGDAWRQRAAREFVELGLIRPSLLDAARRRSKDSRTADELAGLRARQDQLDAERSSTSRKIRVLERRLKRVA